MLKKLTRSQSSIYHYIDGKRTEGAPSTVRGDLSGISGDLSEISGDINDCEITDEDRKKGISVSDLIA